jgi:predicted metal-dependent peptidase
MLMKNTRLAQARLSACRRWPAATAAILSLVPVERRGLGTLAVDAHWRLYFDPDYLASVNDDCAALIILHEVSHLLLRHHERGRSVTQWELWNIATDCSINERLQAEGNAVPPDWLLPARLELPSNQTAEQYFRALKDRQDEEHRAAPPPSDKAGKQDQPTDSGADSVADNQRGASPQDQAAQGEAATKGGSPGAGAGSAPTNAGEGETPCDAVKPGTSGSCADGRQRPWESPAPCDDAPDESLPPAMPKHEQELLIRDVAERIAKAAGTGAGSWAGWAKEILSPRIDPRALLVAAVRKAVEQMSGGHDDTSYRRPSRRPSVGGVIRPSRVAIVPRILLIVDSSGSMSDRDLGYALGLIGKVLAGFRLRDGVQVMVGDAAVQSYEKVFDPKRLNVRGGGGTDMSKLVVAASELNPKPQLIVVATDGCTDWPRTNVGVPVVACLTRQSTLSRVPGWITSIVLA